VEADWRPGMSIVWFTRITQTRALIMPHSPISGALQMASWPGPVWGSPRSWDRKKERETEAKPEPLHWVPEGGRTSTQVSHCIDRNPEWIQVMKMTDLKEQLQFPQEIAQTTLRPDIVIWSRNPKRVVMVELTVPWEERIEESHELKRSKYEDLAQSCKSNGWNTQVFPIEVGCRGFPSQSVWRMLGALGIKGAARKHTVHALGRTAEKASSWLWMLRSKREWQPR